MIERLRAHLRTPDARWLLAIVVLALLVRVLAVAYVHPSPCRKSQSCLVSTPTATDMRSRLRARPRHELSTVPSARFFEAPSTKLRSIFSSENGMRASSCRFERPVP